MLVDILKNIGTAQGKECFSPNWIFDEPNCPEELI